MTQPHLKRHMGLWDATSTVVGIVLGSGIFVAPAALTAVAPSTGSAGALWLGGALVALCGALCYAECGARLPQDGGFFIFYRVAWGPSWGSLAGWIALWVTYPASLAGVTAIGGQYCAELLPNNSRPQLPNALALGLLGFTCLTNIWGLRPSLWTQRALSSTKVVALLALCVAAVWHPRQPAIADVVAPVSPTYGHAWAVAFAVLMWTYDGWSDVTLITGEIRSPGRNVSRAVMLGLAVLAAVYIAVQYAVSSLLPASQAATSQRVLAEATAVSLGPWAGQAVAWLVVLSCVSSAHSVLMTSSRLAYAMGTQRAIPVFFGTLQSRLGTPMRASLGLSVLAALYLVANNFEQLVGFFSFTVWVFYGATALTLLRLRRRHVGEPVAFRAPGGWVPPAVILIAATAMLMLQFWESPVRTAVGAAILIGTGYGQFRLSRLKR